MEVEFADLGKIILANGIVSDWLWFRQSRGFPRQFLGLLRDVLLKEPPLEFAFQQERFASVCVLRYQGSLFFCTVQRRSEGELIDLPESGRGYTERRIVQFSSADYLRIFESGDRLYMMLLKCLTEDHDGKRKHPFPEEDRLVEPMVTEDIPKSENLIINSHQYIDQLAATYTKVLWDTREKPNGGILWNLYFNLYFAIKSNKNVLVIKDVAPEEIGLAVDDYLLVIEILQNVLHFEEPAKAPLSFALDYFFDDTFDILFAHPQDARGQFNFAKIIKLSEIMNSGYREKIVFEKPLSLSAKDKLPYYQIPLSNPFKLLYIVYFLGEFASFEIATQTWLELVEQLHSGHWGDFCINLFKGKINSKSLQVILNSAINYNTKSGSSRRREALTRELFFSILDEPKNYATDVDPYDPYYFLSAALGLDAALAYNVIMYYAGKVNSVELKRFADNAADKHTQVWVDNLLKRIQGRPR